MVIRMVIRMVSRMVIRMVSRMVILWLYGVLEGPQYEYIYSWMSMSRWIPSTHAHE